MTSFAAISGVARRCDISQNNSKRY